MRWVLSMQCQLIGFSCLIVLNTLVTWVTTDSSISGLNLSMEGKESAAIRFVELHVPEMIPLLHHLKTTDQQRYEQEITDIYQITQLLKKIRSNEKRHELELNLWVTQNKAQILVAQLSVSPQTVQPKAIRQLRDLAGTLVRLNKQILELREKEIESELADVRSVLESLRRNRDEHIQKEMNEFLRPISAKPLPAIPNADPS